MQSHEQLFDDFCRENQIGELATDENTHPATLGICNAFNRFFQAQCLLFTDHLRVKRKHELEVFLGFCANPTLNAFAARHSSSLYFIGLNTGAFVQLGHAYEQLGKAPSLNSGVRLGALQGQFGREQIVSNVANFAAIQFLFGHELGHIAHGHTDLISNEVPESGIRALAEANSRGDSDTIPPELFQSMEVDADLYATSSLIGQLARGSLCGIDMLQFLASRSDVLRVSSVAVLALFHLFYGSDVSVATYRSQTHPLPEVRLLKFWLRVWQMRELLPDVNVQEPTSIMEETIRQVPGDLKDSLFPALKLEGGIDIAAEAARVRANEDRFEQRLASVAMIPVGAVIY